MIIASVNVYQCDECGLTLAVKSDTEFEAFEAAWHVGFHHDFCPACRYKIATQARILHDEQTVIAAGEKEKKNVANFS